MEQDALDDWDEARLALLADEYIEPVSRWTSDDEFLAWLETNPDPQPEMPFEREPTPTARQRRQVFLDGIGLLRHDAQLAQVAQIRWIAAEVAAYAIEAPNEIQESIQDRVLMTEVALTLGITERASQNLIERAKILSADRSRTLNAVENGLITLRHAEEIADAGAGLFGELGERFEQEALEAAQRMTPPKLKRELVAIRERLQPSDSEERHKDALLDRKVLTCPNGNGMGEVWANVSGEIAVAIDAKLDAEVRSIKNAGLEDGRTAAQIRADVFSDLLLNDASGARSIRAVVFLTAPAATAIGGDQPAELQGHGPIDPATARELIALSQTFYRVLISPTTGGVVDIDTAARYIPSSLRRLVTLRDGTCRFPGCNRKAVGLDLDHVDEHSQGGPTAPENLTALCRKHHRLKHLAKWFSALDPTGIATWTSPSGRVDVTHPAIPISIPRPIAKAPPPPPKDPLDEWWNPADLLGPLPFRRGGAPDPRD